MFKWGSIHKSSERKFQVSVWIIQENEKFANDVIGVKWSFIKVYMVLKPTMNVIYMGREYWPIKNLYVHNASFSHGGQEEGR